MPPCGRELLVAVHNISKSYGGTTAVAGVTLTLWAGEICGFVGANGAGKTTTLRMLAGILKPDGGRGHVLGFDLRRDAAKIRERVGYMSQRLSLYAELSVSENLRFRAAVYGLRNPQAEVEAAMPGVWSGAVGPQPGRLALRRLGAPAAACCHTAAFAATRAPR